MTTGTRHLPARGRNRKRRPRREVALENLLEHRHVVTDRGFDAVELCDALEDLAGDRRGAGPDRAGSWKPRRTCDRYRAGEPRRIRPAPCSAVAGEMSDRPLRLAVKSTDIEHTGRINNEIGLQRSAWRRPRSSRSPPCPPCPLKRTQRTRRAARSWRAAKRLSTG